MTKNQFYEVLNLPDVILKLCYDYYQDFKCVYCLCLHSKLVNCYKNTDFITQELIIINQEYVLIQNKPIEPKFSSIKFKLKQYKTQMRKFMLKNLQKVN